MRRFTKYIPIAATVLVFIALYVLGCLLYADKNFNSLRVFVNLFGDNAFVGVVAVGATFVILSGGIDLSVGSVVAFTSILISVLVGQGMSPVAALMIGLAIGTVFGALMGWLIHAFELPPFLVTLAGMFFMRGLGFVVHKQSLAIKHAFYSDTISGLAIPLQARVSLPFTATCLLAAVIVATFIAGFTRFGRNVYALGSSENSARLMGLPIGSTKIGIYALSGFFSAAGGCVATFYMQSGNPASFVGLELDAIAAVVIGGTLLSGGVGYVPGTLLGVLILGIIQTLITFQGNLNTWWTKIAVGFLLLLFILLQKAIAPRKTGH
jgi:galactofuranose transport system permease protein